MKIVFGFVLSLPFIVIGYVLGVIYIGIKIGFDVAIEKDE